MDCCAHEGPTAGDARFDLQRVADGVHVAVAAPAYKVNSNTAIIESDDGVVIVDTHSKPSAARVIVDRVRELTAKPVRFVVNTHFHWDHWHGNEVYPAAYPGAEIITNQLTREAMVKKGLKRIQDHVRQVPAEVARLRGELAAATTTEQRAKLQADLRLAESYLAEVRALKPALPTMAFERTMKLYRRDREIHLLYLGRAHTEGDVFVYLPKERTVITGDAVIGWTPYMGDGYPEDWVTTHRPAGRAGLRHVSSWATATRRVGTGCGLSAGTSTTWWRRCARRSPPARAWTRSSSGCPRAWPRPTRRRSRPTSHYRPWRAGLLANIERTYAMVS